MSTDLELVRVPLSEVVDVTQVAEVMKTVAEEAKEGTKVMETVIETEVTKVMEMEEAKEITQTPQTPQTPQTTQIVQKSQHNNTTMLKPIKPRVEEARKEEEEMKTLLKSAIFQLEEELFDLYTTSDEDGNAPSENDVVTSQENAEHVRKLVEQYLSPVIFSLLSNTTQLRLQTKSLKMQAFSIQKTVGHQEGKKKTSWSIYLSEHAKNLPGWKEATAKLTFASAEYKKLSQEEKDQIVIQFYTSRNLPVPTPGSTHHHQKVARVSGLDAFRKHWYEERKKTNPEARGLDSMRCTKDWAALSEADQAEWKELRRQQVAGLI